MPYIGKDSRPEYDDTIDILIDKLNNKPVGHINYCISRIIWALFNRKKSYTFGNSLMGMLLCVAHEFYRRKLAGHEDLKIMENGDILEGTE